jgi:tripartite-type tricarboxylate transporter receptor subunit TctC
MRNGLCGTLAVIASLFLAMPAPAQTYPSKPVRVVVPVPAGALSDVIARRISAELSTRLGQPFIMDNKPGANFIPAAEACKHAPADGYTLCVFTTSTFTFNPHLISNLPYDPDKDFRPIINLGMLLGGLVAAPSLPVSSMQELQALAMAKPGTLNLGTYGPASSANVFRQYLADKWKTNIVEVPYKGANELVAALVSGEIQLTWTAVGNWADNPNNSKGKILVIDGTHRSPLLPNVPTYPEVGIGDYPIHTWLALFAPGGVPDSIITRINAEAQAVIKSPVITKFLTDQLIEPAPSSVSEFAAYVAREKVETAKILTRFNIPKL